MQLLVQSVWALLLKELLPKAVGWLAFKSMCAGLLNLLYQIYCEIEIALDIWRSVGNLNVKQSFLALRLAEKQAKDESYPDAVRQQWLEGLHEELWCFVQKDLSDPEAWSHAWEDLQGQYSATVIEGCWGIEPTAPESISKKQTGEMKKHSRTARDGLAAKRRRTPIFICHVLSILFVLAMWVMSLLLFWHLFRDSIAELVSCLGWLLVCVWSLAVSACLGCGCCFGCFGSLVAVRRRAEIHRDAMP